jgi:drug/metabolite transporter (DMT)-like permease
MSSLSVGADSLIGFTGNVATVPTAVWTGVWLSRLRDYDARPLQKHPSPLVLHAAMASVSVLFSLNYIISKIGLHAFSPLTFAWVRVAAAALIINVLFRERNAAPLEPGDGWRIAGFAVLGVVINQTLFLAGLAFTSAHVASILITTVPIFALAAAIVIGRERATAAKIGGITLAAVGALVVVGGEGFAGTMKSLIGDLLIIGNSLAYALYLVASKPAMARISARRVIARMFAVSAVIMLPIAAWPMMHEPWPAIPSRAWLALGLVIIGPTVAAYLLNAWALKYAESSVVAAYTYLQPVFTVFLAAIFLHEQVRPIIILAAAMIFAGVYISGRPARDVITLSS